MYRTTEDRILHDALQWTANATNYYRKHSNDITSCNWMEANDQLHVPEILTPGKEPFGSHEIRIWVGPRAIPDIKMSRTALGLILKDTES